MNNYRTNCNNRRIMPGSSQSMQNMHLPRSTFQDPPSMAIALVGQFSTHFLHLEHESDAMGMLLRDPNIPSSSSVFLAE